VTRRSSRPRGSRSVAEILWSNTFTLFNLILGSLLALTIALGDLRDALFGGVIVANTAIGVIQELRAKRVLDRLAVLVAPRARVRGADGVRQVAVEEVAPGDRVVLEPGDQVVADGRLESASDLSLDESILTGESESVQRGAGEEVLSGAYCVGGTGEYRVEAVGGDSFAGRLAAEARGTPLLRSPLQRDIDRILKLTVAAMLPLACVLAVGLVVRGEGIVPSSRTLVAALVPLIPEGLVLLTSVTFAVAAIRLARLGALAQRLNAIESLASVDTLCLDKTGTLTGGGLRVEALEAADPGGDAGLRAALGALAAGASFRNDTLSAVAEALPAPPGDVIDEVPFSSARKWSAVTLAGPRSLVLGAPDVLAREGVAVSPALRERLARHVDQGRRVLLLAEGRVPLADHRIPAGMDALGLVVLSEAMRPDAAGTVGFLAREGVAIRVISGDDPRTVRAVAIAAGVPDADRAVSGIDLVDGAALEEAAASAVVFGRTTPDQKRDLVQAMTRRGRFVAMTGDGVNDVLALREARLGIAMGGGSQIAKGVADLVLVTGAFSSIPRAVEEGRRILRNTHRVAKLFVAKTVSSAVILLALGPAPIAFPFLPRQITVASTLTIGIPALLLALAPSEGPVRREGFMAGLLAFVVPAGAISALTVVAGYLLARGPLDAGVVEGRTAATLLLTGMGLAIVIEVERGLERRRVRPWLWGLVACFALTTVLGLRSPWLRDFFALAVPSPSVWILVGACLAVGVTLLVAVRRIPRLARIETRAA
jgi:magnesium-transporting ATPase (P-type)